MTSPDKSRRKSDNVGKHRVVTSEGEDSGDARWNELTSGGHPIDSRAEARIKAGRTGKLLVRPMFS